MRIDLDCVFKQIINIQVENIGKYRIKDMKLDLQEEYEYDMAMGYVEAYDYLCECLLLDEGDNNSQKILDLFLIHQYLNCCYLSEKEINHLSMFSGDLDATMDVAREGFAIYRIVGAFEACIKQYEILEKSSLWRMFEQAKKMQIMKETAKAYRNIGDFYSALKLYFDCLKMNPEKDWLQRVELLLKIGKVYRNYLMQYAFARFFVEEAYALLKENSMQSFGNKKERRYAIICLDILGQIYRDERDYEKAERFFKESGKLYGKEDGRAYIHERLMKYRSNAEENFPDLSKDIEFLTGVITNLKKNPLEEMGAGIRSIQLAALKFRDVSREKSEAYEDVYKGRYIAYKYNDVRTIIRSYIAEADFLKQEKRYEDYVKVSKTALRLASENNHFILENGIIKDIIELTNTAPDIIDSATKIELIRRRKDIYKMLVQFSKFSIDIACKEISSLFSNEKLIAIYKIVLDDFEQILSELNTIIEILNIEIDKINQKYIASEIKGYTLKSILHKFKNDLPDEKSINDLRILCGTIQTNQPEWRETLLEVDKQLETFSNIIVYIKLSANEALKEAGHEKGWQNLDDLIRMGIKNFSYARPKYEENIHFRHSECLINIFVQSTLFVTTISEILNNAFRYAEAVIGEKGIKEEFRFFLDVRTIEKRAVVLECYSWYQSHKVAAEARRSIEKGMEHRKSMPAQESRYGFQSMKFLFENLMCGKMELIQEENKAGIRIRLPIDSVHCK